MAQCHSWALSTQLEILELFPSDSTFLLICSSTINYLDFASSATSDIQTIKNPCLLVLLF